VCADDTQAREESLTFSDFLHDSEFGVASFYGKGRKAQPSSSPVRTWETKLEEFEKARSHKPPESLEYILAHFPKSPPWASNLKPDDFKNVGRPPHSPLLGTNPARLSSRSDKCPGPASDVFDSPPASPRSLFRPAMETIPADYSRRQPEAGPESYVFDSPLASPRNLFHPIMETIPADYSLRRPYSVKGEARLVDEISAEEPNPAYCGRSEIERQRREEKHDVIESPPEPLPQALDDDDEIESAADPWAHSFQPVDETIPADYGRLKDVGTGRDDCQDEVESAPTPWAYSFQPVGETIPADYGRFEDFGVGKIDEERESSTSSDVKPCRRVVSSAQLRRSRLKKGFEGHDKLAPRQLKLSGMWETVSTSSTTTPKEEKPAVAVAQDEAAVLAAHLRRQRESKPSTSVPDTIMRDNEDDIDDDDEKSPQTVVPSSQTQPIPSLGDRRRSSSPPADLVIPSSQTQHVESLHCEPDTQVVESSQTQHVPSLDEWV
jgi:hypothetical protein